MIEVNRVLCPVDLSEASARAFDYAVDFARWYEARLTALHVVPPVPVMLGATGALPPPPPDDEGERRAALSRFVAERAPAGGPEIETVFMMPAESYSYLSSRLVKEVFQLGGTVTGLVPPVVERRLQDKYGAMVRPPGPARRRTTGTRRAARRGSAR